MAGNRKKIRFGAAWVTFGTVLGPIGEIIDCGYTIGGVNFTVETQGHEILVDQEGISPVAESILGRKVTATVPMAESNYERINKMLPDSTYGPDSTGYLLEVASGLGKNLMDFADVLTITSKFDANDWIKVYAAAPIANLNAAFTAQNERIWPVQFKGYVTDAGGIYAGKIFAMHEGVS